MAKKKKKQKRKVTNKTRDMLADYYKTNKAYGEENRKRQEEEGEEHKGLKNLNTMEKTCVIIIILGGIGIILRYFVLHI